MKTAVFVLCVVGVVGVPAEEASAAQEQTLEARAATGLCPALLDARRRADAEGRLDFAVQLGILTAVSPPEGSDAGTPLWSARVRMGSPYTVGRIGFAGHRAIDESTLRRIIGIQERDRFDVGKLRRGIARLNGSGLFEPLTPDAVEVRANAADLSADVFVTLRERPRGRWSISAPLAPLTGTLQAAISSRLPAWGRGVFDLATWYATLTVMSPWNPLARLLPSATKPGTWWMLALDRPWLPGHAFSGFTLSPALSPRETVTRYGLTHLGRGARGLIAAAESGSLVIPLPATSGSTGDDQVLVCDPPKPRLQWLRRGADLALGMLLP